VLTSFIALVIGLAVAVAGRTVLHARTRSRRPGDESRRRAAVAGLVVYLIGAALVVVGLVGVSQAERAGERLPVPLDLIWIALLLVIGAQLAWAVLRRRRAQRARDSSKPSGGPE
jgi:protein-S-isoprenylcysteine O-methyltransferase Ste14